MTKKKEEHLLRWPHFLFTMFLVARIFDLCKRAQQRDRSIRLITSTLDRSLYLAGSRFQEQELKLHGQVQVLFKQRSSLELKERKLQRNGHTGKYTPTPF